MRQISQVAFWTVLIAVPHGVTSARAQGLQWSPEFWTGPEGTVRALGTHDAGSGPELYLGGGFCCIFNWQPFVSSNIVRWNGQTWGSLGGGTDDYVFAIASYDWGLGPRLFIGGAFGYAGGVPVSYIAQWDGSSWSSLTNGGVYGQTVARVYALIVHDFGNGPRLFVGGQFGNPGSAIASYDGAHWSPLGTGLQYSGGTPVVRSMCVFDDGTGPALIVGGDFTAAGGGPASNIASWDGAGWSALGPGSSGTVRAMTVFDDGNGPALYAGAWVASASAGCISRWDGTSWTAVGNIDSDGYASSLTVFDDGTGPALFAGSTGIHWGGGEYVRIAKWNGATWSKVGDGLSQSVVYALAAHDDGTGPKLYAGGWFTTAAGIPSHHMAAWKAAQGPLSSVCPGDGAFRNCPCSGFGAAGHGCPNSQQAAGGLLQATGATGDDSILLQGSDLTPSTTGVFFQGSAFVTAGIAFGDGLRCAGGTIIRLFTKAASNGMVSAPEPGDPTLRVRALSQGDALPPGAVRYYQFWYRDPSPTFCDPASTFNTTNGLRIVW